MVGAGILIIWLIIWSISSGANLLRSNKKYTHECPSGIAGVIYYIFFLFIVLMVLSVISQIITGTSYIVLGVVFFISPYLVSKVTIEFAWVKASFFLASTAYIINGRSVFAGGLFAGYQAAKKITDLEERQKSLRWLRDKYLKIGSNRKLYSGEIVMFVLIDSALTHPGNNEYLTKRLAIVSFLPATSIPKPIVLYVVKRSLAHVLPANNWDLVITVIKKWSNTPTRLTSFIEGFYDRHVLNEKSVDLMPYFMKSLLAFRYNVIKQWCYANSGLVKAGDSLIDSKDDAVRAIWLKGLSKSSFDEIDKKNILNSLTGLEQQHIWQTRAKELSINNDVWQELVGDVNQNLEEEQLSEDQKNFIDDRHQALNYIVQNIRRKWDSNSYCNSAEESVDWLQFFFTFNELGVNKSEQTTAFSIHSTFLWDAIAGFWNTPNEYRLSYMLASICSPYAQECGLDEFSNTINFIISK